jgi:hypothetical protein
VKFSVYQDKKGHWRWRLVAANKLIVADSSEGYVNKTDCQEMLQKIIENILSGKFEVEL